MTEHHGGANAVAIEVTGLTKRYPGVVANDNVSLRVQAGTVHAIVGENGAGKSTLVKMLYGEVQPDAGTIAINGNQHRLRGPATAIAAGIGMVHQHFMLVDNFTALENIVLGHEPRTGLFSIRVDWSLARQQVSTLAKDKGIDIDLDALAGDLGVGGRQRIEILKVLYRGARIIIMDEPTTVLVPHEVDALCESLRSLARSGNTVIFISHKLDEVMQVADTITVMRAGRSVTTGPRSALTQDQIVEAMIGHSLPSIPGRSSTPGSDVVLSLRDVGVVHTFLTDVTFDVHASQIVGIAGVEGNGQSELLEAIMGLVPTEGVVTLSANNLAGSDTRRRRELGLACIPEDRQRQGLLLDAALWENRALGHQSVQPCASHGWLQQSAIQEDTARLMHEFDVRAHGVNVAMHTLSGGNQQKLVVARELAGLPRCLIAAHPTRGVDVGSQIDIWQHLRTARDAGLAVLLVSADLDELLALSDVIHVMMRGRLVGSYDPAHIDVVTLGRAMTGATS